MFFQIESKLRFFLSYTQRLTRAKLQSLELRRLCADLAFCYKILKGLVAIPPDTLFSFNTSSNTRGHSMKLQPIKPRLETRRSFFACRVVKIWNTLTEDMIGDSSKNIAIFKKRLDSKTLAPHLLCILI